MNASEGMKSDNVFKHAGVAFGLALIIYVTFYSCDHHLRGRKGPWEVTFTREGTNAAIVINQPALRIQNVKVAIVGEPSGAREETVRFDLPEKLVPLGKVEFEDLTYLPGSVTFNLSGHAVELLPRTLVLDGKEAPWKSNAIYLLIPSEKFTRWRTRSRPK